MWAIGDLRNGVAGFDSMAHSFEDLNDPSMECMIVYAAQPVRVPSNVLGNAKVSVLSLGLAYVGA